MKTLVVLAVSIVLVSILLCPMVIAFPSIPDDVQIVQPDPSLPKQLSAFVGKWEGCKTIPRSGDFCLYVIVEKIDAEHATLVTCQNMPTSVPELDQWTRRQYSVIAKGEGKYILSGTVPSIGTVEYHLGVGNVYYSDPIVTLQLTRIRN